MIMVQRIIKCRTSRWPAPCHWESFQSTRIVSLSLLLGSLCDPNLRGYGQLILKHSKNFLVYLEVALYVRNILLEKEREFLSLLINK
jgi:hypothetical protein